MGKKNYILHVCLGVGLGVGHYFPRVGPLPLDAQAARSPVPDRKSQVSRGHQDLQRRQVGPSQLRRRARRAADPAVQQRAAEYAVDAAATPALPLPSDVTEQVSETKEEGFAVEGESTDAEEDARKIAKAIVIEKLCFSVKIMQGYDSY